MADVVVEIVIDAEPGLAAGPAQRVSAGDLAGIAVVAADIEEIGNAFPGPARVRGIDADERNSRGHGVAQRPVDRATSGHGRDQAAGRAATASPIRRAWISGENLPGRRCSTSTS